MFASQLLPHVTGNHPRELGRALADQVFDYTAADSGASHLRSSITHLASSRVPVCFPPGPTERDAAEHVRWVAAAARHRSKITGWAVAVAVVATVITWIMPGAGDYAVIVPLAAIAVVVWIRSQTQDPAAIPMPPDHDDPRQAELERDWKGAALTAAQQRLAELSTARARHAYGPRPTGRRRRLTYSEAEKVAGEWMAFLGARKVVVSQATRDGGIDVHADGFVAQVKWQANPVSPGPLHQIFGVGQASASRPAKALFFASASAGYSKEARKFADQVGMALFTLSEDGGTLSAVNETGERARQAGLATLWT